MKSRGEEKKANLISTLAGLFYLIMKASQIRMDKIKEASRTRSEAACIWQVLIKIKKEKEPHGKESRVIGAW